MLPGNKRIHFVGLGGIGMSGIASVLLQKGYSVSGSDVEANHITRKLQLCGARVYKGHAASNISKEVGLLVYSSSIAKDNPELKAARRRKIRLAHRAEVLGEIFNSKKGIAVTGTHGKTTTTSLISVMLKHLKADPTVVIGGEVEHFGGNAALGKGAYVVAEADESDSSFLHLTPYYSVITNIEAEHMDHFKDMSDIRTAYKAFAKNTKKGGMVFYNIDDVNCREIAAGTGANTASFGFSADADIRPENIIMSGFNTSFDCIYKGKALGSVRLNIPGRHNVLNALAAILVGLKAGYSFKAISGAFGGFYGAKRRFQLRIESDGVMLIEDYAHHPTEIRSVLEACKNWNKRRIVVIFQPHRYSRTKCLADDFGTCFAGADKLILTDIYAASEKPIDGVSINSIFDKVKASGFTDVSIMKKEGIAEHVVAGSRQGDMILVLGAGDIGKTAEEMERMLRFKDIVKELKAGIKGEVKEREIIARHTSFKIGGPARVWVAPADTVDLKKVLGIARKHKVSTFVIGNGSNLLGRDEGFNGVVISLSAPAFKLIKRKGAVMTVGAGFSLPKLVRLSCEMSLGGLESLVGIPGTVGGAIYMNAGGWTSPMYKNMSDITISLKTIDMDGKPHRIKRSAIDFGYRMSNLKGHIIIEADLKFVISDKNTLIASSLQFLKIKKEKQALDIPSAGCVFKNPSGSQFTCGQMIDILGLKGMRVGGAEVSAKHANFIVNKGGATCRDVLALTTIIKGKVKDNYGIDLELEVEVL